MRVWFVTMGDKAHAWNEYVERLWPISKVAFFIDGAAMPHTNAFDAITSGLESHSEAWGATGVPTCGISARSQREMLLTEGGIHGNLYAVRGVILNKLIDAGFKLPRGIYRTDPLLAAALCFSLDPSRNNWNIKRIHVESKATWDYDALRWWRVRDLHTHFKRIKRQKQGVLENAAIKHWLAVEKRLPSDLPHSAVEMVKNWIDNHPREAQELFSMHPGCREALKIMTAQRDWSAIATPPIFMGQVAF